MSALKSVFWLGLFVATSTLCLAQEFGNPEILDQQDQLSAPIELTDDMSRYLAEKQYGATFFYDQVPDAYQKDITIEQPESNSVSLQNTITIRGKNGFGTPTFLNGKALRLRGDGAFYHEYTLSGEGKQVLFLTFMTPDQKFFSVKRHILRLLSPPDIDVYKEDRKALVYFYNTPFVSETTQKKALSMPFTRAEFAYFLSHLLTEKPKGDLYFTDVTPEYWAADCIAFSVSEGYMSVFPDGSFQPDTPVTQLEYLMTIIRALKLPLNESTTPIPYRESSIAPWQAKFIRTALTQQLILATEPLTLSAPMTLKEFFLKALRIDAVQASFEHLVDFSDGFELTQAMQDELLHTLYQEFVSEDERKESLRKIVFYSPETRALVVSDNVVFEGKIYPIEEFKIGEVLVIPDQDGNFMKRIPLKNGRNVFSVQALHETTVFSVIRLEPYTDLEGHWLNQTAAELKQLNLLENSPLFYPKEHVSRSELAHYVDTFLIKEETLPETVYDPEDLTPEDPNYLSIKRVLAQEIMSLDANNLYHPDRIATRAEALTAIMRALGSDQDTPNKPDRFPFSDIPNQHWARQTIEKGLVLGIISPSPKFSPNTPITKAEFIAMLASVPSIKLLRETLWAL